MKPHNSKITQRFKIIKTLSCPKNLLEAPENPQSGSGVQNDCVPTKYKTTHHKTLSTPLSADTSICMQLCMERMQQYQIPNAIQAQEEIDPNPESIYLQI